MKTNVYRGTFTNANWFRVFLNGEPLDPKPSQQIRDYNADFAWGMHSQGATQLALAILLQESGNESFALKHYQAFRRDVITPLPRTEGVEWIMEGSEVQRWQRGQSFRCRISFGGSKDES